jgi:hypothetical protein
VVAEPAHLLHVRCGVGDRFARLAAQTVDAAGAD